MLTFIKQKIRLLILPALGLQVSFDSDPDQLAFDMFVLILIAIAFIALACVAPHFYNLAYQWRTLKRIPSLPQNPIIGHGSSFLGKSPAEILTLLWETQKKFGKLVKYNLVNSLVLTISDPKVAEVRGCLWISVP